ITVLDLWTAADPKVAGTIKLDAPVTAAPLDAAGMATDADTGAPPPAAEAGADGDDAQRSDATGGDAGRAPPSAIVGKADVSITPRGQFAVLRREGSPVVT